LVGGLLAGGALSFDGGGSWGRGLGSEAGGNEPATSDEAFVLISAAK
jgi:hypothetical protein